MKTLTLAFLFRGNKILLAVKKRGFGALKWNGYGGKMSEGEAPLDSVVREIKEESNLEVEKESCKKLGSLDFYFTDFKEWDQRVIIYRIDDFPGEPEETEEMKPEWFLFDDIPYSSMWVGDDKWLLFVIEGKKFDGEVRFSEKGEKLQSFSFN